ncbi:MAG: hypothetical protein C0599_07440 [Salinivirgaceae bacterium]|nr:MAG: hypothetical protein C0599_07440 [Salinivirgaceae bacterium]
MKCHKQHLYNILTAIFLLALSLLPDRANAQNDSLKISVLTVSKGVEVHSLFGHTAIRVRNINQHTDIVYNFGLFDFDTPFFFYKFLSGKLPYALGTHKYYDFLKIYASQNRRIDEQHLSLKIYDKIKISDTLRYLYKPENRKYKYEFFDKNCTSIVRDILLKSTGNYDTLKQLKDTITYRGMLNLYLENRPWYKLGINLITGTYVDKKLNQVEAMALPDMFMNQLNTINYNGHSIVYKHNTITKKESSSYKVGNVLSPFNVFVVLIILYLIFKSRWIKYSIAVYSSLLGLFLMFLWVITEHIDLQSNWDVLIFNPLYFVLFCDILKCKKVIRPIAIILLLLLLIRAIISLIGVQEIIVAYIPMIVLEAIILVNVAKSPDLKIH